MNNPSQNPVNLTSITVSDTGAPVGGITSIGLWMNGTLMETVNVTGPNTTFNINDVISGNNGAVTFEVTANFSLTAPVGSYPFSVTNAVGSNDQPVIFTGIPVTGATITIVSVTATSTVTGTSTALPTETKTPTPSFKTVVVYPNPATGGMVELNPNLTTESDVSIEMFTIAFRKVVSLNKSNIQPGESVPIPLVDKTGTPLASGLYYVVVQTNQGRSVLKQLILR